MSVETLTELINCTELDVQYLRKLLKNYVLCLVGNFSERFDAVPVLTALNEQPSDEEQALLDVVVTVFVVGLIVGFCF